MSDKSSNGRPMQKPVFIIEPFDKNCLDHMKGMITIKMNRKQATDLSHLIRESELSEDEGHIYAMQGNIRRWYDERRKEIQVQKATQAIPCVDSVVPIENAG